MLPKISIITVVYNAKDTIEQTIQSVLNQTYSNVEYIIIDGASSDGTTDIINRYLDRIHRFVSEKDKGIYDAMNKGIAMATGDLINFVNAGDGYIDNKVLAYVGPAWEEKGRPDLLYGNAWIEYDGGKRLLVRAGNDHSQQWKGPVFRHGAMFVNTELQQEYPFRLEKEYRVCADFDFIYHMHVLGKRFEKIDRDIMYFQAEGVSSNYVAGIKHNRMVVLSYTPDAGFKRWYSRFLLRAHVLGVVRKPAKALINFGVQLLRSYVPNAVITHIPFYFIRHFYYRKVCGIKIGKGASIHMRTYINGAHITIGENSVINRSCMLDGRDQISIGSNVSVSPYVHVITGTHDLDSPYFSFVSRPVIIEDYAWIGSRATILPGVRIGKGAVVAVGAIVTTDVEPYAVVAGIPARKIGERSSDLRYNTSWLPLFN